MSHQHSLLITHLVELFNQQRKAKALPLVTWEWQESTGNWLRESLKDGTSRTIATPCLDEQRFIGLLEGLTYEPE